MFKFSFTLIVLAEEVWWWLVLNYCLKCSVLLESFVDFFAIYSSVLAYYNFNLDDSRECYSTSLLFLNEPEYLFDGLVYNLEEGFGFFYNCYYLYSAAEELGRLAVLYCGVSALLGIFASKLVYNGICLPVASF